MKKLLLILILPLFISSCDKDDDEPVPQPQSVVTPKEPTVKTYDNYRYTLTSSKEMDTVRIWVIRNNASNRIRTYCDYKYINYNIKEVDTVKIRIVWKPRWQDRMHNDTLINISGQLQNQRTKDYDFEHDFTFNGDTTFTYALN